MPTVILPGDLATNKSFVSSTLPVRVYETFMDSQVGGKMIRTKLGGDPLKNSKVVADDAEHFESSVFLGGPSNNIKQGMRRVAVRAHTVNGETVVELEETKNSAMQIGLILLGLSLCMIPGIIWIVSNMAASKKHKALLDQLTTEVVQTVPGARVG